MTRDVLGRSFYMLEPLAVARNLIGKRLVSYAHGIRVAGMIYETEAYDGEQDLACHARTGKTSRNAIMYEEGGHAYVYFTYGMHHLFNVVTEDINYPSAVLIRAVEPISGLSIIKENRNGRTYHELTSGPAKFTKAFAIDKNFNGLDLTQGKVMWIEDGENIAQKDIAVTSRIGVTFAQECRDWKRRFYIKKNKFVSRY